MAPPRATRSRYHVLPDQVSSRHRTIEIKLPYFMVKGNITIKRYHYYHAWGHKCTSKHYMVLESTTVTIATRRAASVPASIIKDVWLTYNISYVVLDGGLLYLTLRRDMLNIVAHQRRAPCTSPLLWQDSISWTSARWSPPFVQKYNSHSLCYKREV